MCVCTASLTGRERVLRETFLSHFPPSLRLFTHKNRQVHTKTLSQQNYKSRFLPSLCGWRPFGRLFSFRSASSFTFSFFSAFLLSRVRPLCLRVSDWPRVSAGEKRAVSGGDWDVQFGWSPWWSREHCYSIPVPAWVMYVPCVGWAPFPCPPRVRSMSVCRRLPFACVRASGMPCRRRLGILLGVALG